MYASMNESSGRANENGPLALLYVFEGMADNEAIEAKFMLTVIHKVY